MLTDTTKAICQSIGRPCPKFVLKHLPRYGGVRSILPNGGELRLWSRGDDWISNQVYWRGWTADEPEVLPLFYQLAKTAAVILDIGAHVGLYSLVASYANPCARIFAFEPYQIARERLAFNIGLNRRANIQVIPSAVSDTCGQQPFYCTESYLPCSSSLSHDFMTQSTTEPLRCLQASVTTIDDFCREHGIGMVHLAKLDIEGLEPQAIEGMRTTIEKSRPDLFVEILFGKGTDTTLDRLTKEFGYNVFALDADGPHFQPHISVDMRRRNYLFTTLAPAELEGALVHGFHRLFPKEAPFVRA